MKYRSVGNTTNHGTPVRLPRPEGHSDELEKYCRLARNRRNVFLDTSGVAPYYSFGRAIGWAGVEKITFASDGFMYVPLMERAKIEALHLPGPYRTPRLTEDQMAMVLGGTMRRLLES